MITLEQVLADARGDAAFVVYGLVDARFPRRVRYVGQTQNLTERLRQHRNHSNGFGAFGDWKRAVLSAGSRIEAIILGTHKTRESALAAEWRLIARWHRRGLCDCNTLKESRHGAWVARCQSASHRRRIAKLRRAA